ncbi:MAG: PadR family transcriptional regulator [Deltaproteobacteria bacterium]|nr:PadR family transcriptional regulator [Deltaproteobacteria bacterium]
MGIPLFPSALLRDFSQTPADAADPHSPSPGFGAQAHSQNSDGFSPLAVIASLVADGGDLSAIPDSKRADLAKKMGAANFNALLALAQERDPQLFGEGLLQIGAQLEEQEKLEWALKLYGTLSQIPAFAEVRERAQKRLDAVTGKGGFGARAEFLLKRLTKDATDPKTIVPMLAGTAVAGLVKTAALAKFAGMSGEAWYARGFGAKAAANLLAYGAEVPVFALSGRGLRQIGRTENSNPEPGVGQELAGAAITLGLLKTFSFAGNQAYAKLHAVNEFGVATRLAGMSRFNQGAIAQSSMFTGLLAAHRLEEQVGLKEHVDGATTVTDTLASMVSMGVGAHLGNQALGHGYARWNREMALRTQAAEKQLESPRRLSSTIGNPLLAPMWMMMGTGGPGGFPSGEGRASGELDEIAVSGPRSTESVIKNSYNHSGTDLEVELASSSPIADGEKQSKEILSVFLDIFYTGEEEGKPLTGDIARRLREDRNLRGSILGMGKKIEVRFDAETRKILSLKAFAGIEKILDLLDTSRNSQAQVQVESAVRPVVPAPPPSPEETQEDRSPPVLFSKIEANAEDVWAPVINRAILLMAKVELRGGDGQALAADLSLGQVLRRDGELSYANELFEACEKAMRENSSVQQIDFVRIRELVRAKRRGLGEAPEATLTENSLAFSEDEIKPYLFIVPENLKTLRSMGGQWNFLAARSERLFEKLNKASKSRSISIRLYGLRNLNSITSFLNRGSTAEQRLLWLVELESAVSPESDPKVLVDLHEKLEPWLARGEMEVPVRPEENPSARRASPLPRVELNSRAQILRAMEFFSKRNGDWRLVYVKAKEISDRLAVEGQRLDSETASAAQETLSDVMSDMLDLAKEGSGMTSLKAMRWLACFEDALAGKITWEEFEAIDPLSLFKSSRNEPTPVPPAHSQISENISPVERESPEQPVPEAGPNVSPGPSEHVIHLTRKIIRLIPLQKFIMDLLKKSEEPLQAGKIVRLVQKFPGTEVKEISVYNAINSLENRGLLKSVRQKSGNGPSLRRYCQVTEAGRASQIELKHGTELAGPSASEVSVADQPAVDSVREVEVPAAPVVLRPEERTVQKRGPKPMTNLQLSTLEVLRESGKAMLGSEVIRVLQAKGIPPFKELYIYDLLKKFEERGLAQSVERPHPANPLRSQRFFLIRPVESEVSVAEGRAPETATNAMPEKISEAPSEDLPAESKVEELGDSSTDPSPFEVEASIPESPHRKTLPSPVAEVFFDLPPPSPGTTRRAFVEREISPRSGERSGLMGMASAFRFFTVPQANSNGTRHFVAHMVLPNLDRIEMPIDVGSDGKIRPGRDGSAERIDARTGERSRGNIYSVEGFRGRIRMVLDGDFPAFDFDLNAVNDRMGGLTRLELAGNQPNYTGDRSAFFLKYPPGPQSVSGLYEEVVSIAAHRHEQGATSRHRLYLTNGDAVEILMASSHHARGKFEILEATLKRMGDVDSIPMEVLGDSGRGGINHMQLRDAKQGFAVEVDFEIPNGDLKKKIEFHSVTLKEPPIPVFLKLGEASDSQPPKAPELDTDAWEIMETDQGLRAIATDVLSGEINGISALRPRAESRHRGCREGLWPRRDKKPHRLRLPKRFRDPQGSGRARRNRQDRRARGTQPSGRPGIPEDEGARAQQRSAPGLDRHRRQGFHGRDSHVREGILEH